MSRVENGCKMRADRAIVERRDALTTKIFTHRCCWQDKERPKNENSDPNTILAYGSKVRTLLKSETYISILPNRFFIRIVSTHWRSVLHILQDRM